MRWLLLAGALALAPLSARAQDEAPVDVPAPDPAEAEAALREDAGRLALRRGDLPSARADFARAFELSPTVARGWALVDADGALGDADAQQAALAALIVLAPDDDRAAEARARLAVLEARPAVVPEPPAIEAPAESEATVVTEPEPDGETYDFLDEPWFWAIVAVVAIGGIVTALILTGDPGTEEPIPGDDGFVVRTLVEW